MATARGRRPSPARPPPAALAAACAFVVTPWIYDRVWGFNNDVFYTVLILASKSDVGFWELSLAVLLSWAASLVILAYASVITRFIGERGVIAIQRLMGMILTTIAVQMLLTGLREYLQTV